MDTFSQTLLLLAETIDLRDRYTAGHSARVAAYARTLALGLGLDDELVREVVQAGLLHDIGKIGVPDAILLKNGPLTPLERTLIELHPTVGAGLIAHVPGSGNVMACVRHHHERIDGSGYPDGLVADAIPLGARIVAVADAFDAMTTDRPYRAALSVDEALVRLGAASGTQFDVRCVGRFCDLVRWGVLTPDSLLTAV